MKESEIGDLTCSLARSLSLIGDAWTLLIVRELFLGTRRYDDFIAVTGMAPKLLSARLKKLEAAGLVKRVLYMDKPKRYEYRLTRMGVELHPVMVTITQWGNRWRKPRGEKTPPLQFRHKTCGHVAEAALICSCCGEGFNPQEIEPIQSTAFLAERESMKSELHRKRAEPEYADTSDVNGEG
ncbi:helix-turn-helix domain-containing protein [Paraburkholderia sp. C35]|uniref:winged helix-turn-helix transcriptional regulator n=1 Tax=Paraburkholderia sp. C35 TaxID=2126993 RepID=UPI000D686F62|nr:helix-turn-helix domain-containing protein [Paraburkholderia sp. C35]